MAVNPPPASAPSFHLGDIYYILFRHKWKIIICAVLGLIAGAVYFKTQKPPFQSTAKLFIRFVISEGRSAELGENDTVTLSTDARGANVMSAELQILSSRDVSEAVAKSMGPEKILGGTASAATLSLAASVVQSSLTAELASRTGSLINLSYKNEDAALAQEILREVINSYLKRHVEIHRAAGMVGNFLAQETDQLRARLAQTEEELRKANSKAGVVSLEASKEAYSQQINRTRTAIFEAQAQLASLISIHEKNNPPPPSIAAPVAPTSDAPAAPPPPEPTSEQTASFQRLTQDINQLRNTELGLLKVFQEGSTRVQETRTQISAAESKRAALLAEFPSLARTPVAAPLSNTRPDNSSSDLNANKDQIIGLQARIKILGEQLEQIRVEASKLDQAEITVMELRRRRQLEEENYRRYAASLEHSRIKEAMGDGKVSNISVVQSPTPAFQDRVMIKKIAAGLGAGGLVLGLAWAVLIEFLFDRTVRRPADVEQLLGAPLFISLPRLKKSPPAKKNLQALPAPGSKPDPNSTPGEIDDVAQLTPFYQTLRDRLISYFESINLRHKPKLIAVTGLGRGSGVTATAAGLARSLSETGEGNVLLVDMTQGQGSAQHFQRGTQIGIDQLLDMRHSALVQDNLYVVSEHSGGERLAKGLPQRFSQLVPKLKTSDFDYIIFDMPAVSQISITPRLASFMDMTLLVLESEKTDRVIAQRAADLLAQSKTRVGVVLNKNKTYVPARLHQDHDFLMGI